jgi:hypothetical protein
VLLPPGTRLGCYEITARIGQGGMGEVYRARDTRLNRDVAVKVLPEAVAQDADRLARFTREAQTLAALNHPNIAQVHGLEESSGVRALVMELVEGADLSELLARGALPLDDALSIARQIAEGLEAAHDQGIIHRDLKPANVKVRPDGTVKVLDFGLAKAIDPNAASGVSSGFGAMESPTLTRHVTQEGVILGTVAYMAPEQARGKAVDRRADIWSFGVVLFEMLSGRLLFPGDTISDTVAAVLTRDPDWTALPGTTPVRVRQLLRRCLERDPRRRLQAIGEARVVLDDPGPAADIVAAGDAPRTATRRWLTAAAAVGAAIALFAAGWWLRPAASRADEPVRKLDLALAGLQVAQGRVPTIAPDGSRVAYLSGGRLHVRRLDHLDPVDLAAGDEVTYPAWSPDSRQVAFARRGRAWKISTEGGTPTELGEVPVDLVGSGGAVWTADGQIVFAGSDTIGLWAVPAEGGAGRDLLPLDRNAEADFHEISALPGGRGLIFTVHRKGTLPDLIAILSGGTRRTLLELPGESLRHPVYSPTGHIVYERETTNPGLWAVPFSLERLATTGPPVLVVAGGRAPGIAQDGTLSFLRPDDTPIELVRISRTGVVEAVTELADTRASMLTSGPLGTGYQQWGGVSVSPDGSRVAVSIGFSPGRALVYEVARGSQSVVASGTFPSKAVWTNDGSRLIYASSRDARAWNLWSRRADGAGEEQRLSTSDEVQLPVALSPDGGTLVYSQGSGPNGNFFKMPVLQAAVANPLFTSRTWGLGASFSPDGSQIAIDALDSGRSEVFIRPYPEGDQRIQVSSGGGTSPVWTRTGEIVYATTSAIVAVSVTTRGGSLSVSNPVELVQTGGESRLAPVFGVTPDGTTLFMLRLRGREQLSLIFNWGAELAGAANSSTPTAR